MKRYYIEMLHKNSEEENYDLQSKWFATKKGAKDWFANNFDYVSEGMHVWVMTAEFYDEDNYDIIKSEELK